MFRFPFTGAHGVAGRRNIPGAQEITLCLAIDDDNKIAAADSFHELGQPIRYRASSSDVGYPFVRPAGIRPLLNKLLLAFAIFANKTTVWVSIFVAFDLEQQCTVFVVIGIDRHTYPPRFGDSAIFAIV